MDPYRNRPPGRYGSSHDLGLFSLFFLTIALMAGVVAVLTVGTAWQMPVLPNPLPQSQAQPSGLFGASAVEKPAAPSPSATSVARLPLVPAGSQATAQKSPTSQPTATPPATPTSQPPTPTPQPTATPGQAQAYVLGNTGGVGAWLRRSPNMNDYLIAWVDGTRMETAGPDVQANGLLWHMVRDPQGNVGYIPAEWLVPVS